MVEGVPGTMRHFLFTVLSHLWSVGCPDDEDPAPPLRIVASTPFHLHEDLGRQGNVRNVQEEGGRGMEGTSRKPPASQPTSIRSSVLSRRLDSCSPSAFLELKVRWGSCGEVGEYDLSCSPMPVDLHFFTPAREDRVYLVKKDDTGL